MSQPTESAPKPVADDIPTDKAWRAGRRIYVRAAYRSTLNTALRDLGAKWDREQGAFWVGSGKATQVIPLIRAQAERIAAVVDIKGAGRWVRIPFEADEIRARAKALGAIWEGATKLWAMPSDESLVEVKGMVAAWDAAAKAAKEAQAAVAKAARESQAGVERADAAKSTADAADHIIASSGRTATDERGQAGGKLYGRMVRAEAEQAKPKPGSVRQLAAGRRVLVLSSTARFVSQDMIDDGLAGDLWDDPGWRYTYQYVVVAPTAEEIASDAAEKAEVADEAEIRAVMQAASRIQMQADWTRVEGATITQDAAGGMTAHGGRITLTPDGGCWYQHPGYYDDFVHVEAEITDVQLIERVRAIVAAGARRRGQYKVQP